MTLPAPHTLTARSPLPAFAMLALMLVLAALDQTILSTALPTMTRELPGTWPLAWVFSAYLLAATVVIALYGRLADVLGTKPMLLLAIGLFLLGSLACGASRNLPQLVLARACQGLGGGGLMTLAMLCGAELSAPEERGRRQTLLGAVYGVATMFGPLVGAALVEHLSWHWAFWINVPLALSAWAVLAWRLPAAQRHRPGRRPPIDWLGALLLAGALINLLLATQHDRLDLPERVSLGLLLLLGIALSLGFLWRQRRAAHPLLPLSLFAHPAYAAVSCISLVTGLTLYAVVVFVPQYLQGGLRLSPTASAWHLLPLMAGVTVAAAGCGRLLRARTPPAGLARAACLLMLSSLGLLVAGLRWWPDMPMALSASLLPLGGGLGLLFPIVTVVAQRVSPTQHRGIATAAPVMLRSLGGAAGVALLTAMLARSMVAAFIASATVGTAMATGLQAVFGCAAGGVLIALLSSWWLPGSLALTPAAGSPSPPAP